MPLKRQAAELLEVLRLGPDLSAARAWLVVVPNQAVSSVADKLSSKTQSGDLQGAIENLEQARAQYRAWTNRSDAKLVREPNLDRAAEDLAKAALHRALHESDGEAKTQAAIVALRTSHEHLPTELKSSREMRIRM